MGLTMNFMKLMGCAYALVMMATFVLITLTTHDIAFMVPALFIYIGGLYLTADEETPLSKNLTWPVSKTFSYLTD